MSTATRPHLPTRSTAAPAGALCGLDASAAARRLARRELSAEALLRACLDRIADREPQLHAFAALLDTDAALAQARALDAGPSRGALHGLPLGVKDLFDTADLPTTYGSALYAGHQPAADAASVALCRAAGALVLGKTVSTEFAYFHPGPTANPHDLAHTPGGSSSGSAAAVADHLLPLALGSQTAGSIVRPAAYCGVVGYKPSLGRVPRGGVKSLSESLDTLGGFGRSVADVALLGGVLCGDERLVALALDETPAAALAAPRIGLCRTPWWDEVDGDVVAAWARAEAALAPAAAALVDVALPASWPDLVTLQKAVMAHEMARSLSHERVAHAERLSERLRALFAEGLAIDGARHVAHLMQTARLQREAADALFGACDVLLAPSSMGEAPAGLAATGDPLFCRGWTLLGLPCVHLPFARGAHGLPVGLQLVGRWGEDERLLAAARWCHERLLQGSGG
jgi:Asp-tRNA(Asn)/Glu-tRNA(Gln) amidotransferase A subunit family amidase